jgi:ATP-dependent exoDNAse (exonuclease V) beta subunit
MTRARNELHLFGSAKLTKKRALQKAGDNTHLGVLWPHVSELFQQKLRTHGRPVEQARLDTPPATFLRRLPAGWRAPVLEPSIIWQTPVRHAAAAARNVTYEWVGDTGRHVGTVVHELLKRVAAGANSSWSPAFVSSELRRLGVPDSQREEAFGRVFRALERTLASERGQWILEQHPGARSEWAIAGRIGATLINGAVDRAFRDADGRFWIIDFKTSDHQGAHLDRFLDEEQRRYHPQLDRYATLVSRLEDGPISLGLYFPLLDAWREWEFEAETLTAESAT